VRVSVLVSSDPSFYSIQRHTLDAILEPMDLQGLVKRFDPIFSQVRMLIMLLNVKGHILVKVEVLLVTLMSEGLELGHNGARCGCNLITSEEGGVQNSPNLSPVLALDLLHVGSPA
jgi:hypothetical protein